MWCKRLSMRTSTRNSLFPWRPLRSSCFTATAWEVQLFCQCPGLTRCKISIETTNILHKKWIFQLNRSKPKLSVFRKISVYRDGILTCPLSRRPLYTRPKPPSPNMQSCLKFLVAAASSRKVKICAAMFWLLPSRGMVRWLFLGSDPPCSLNLSEQKMVQS